jgi:hypothetical protein
MMYTIVFYTFRNRFQSELKQIPFLLGLSILILLCCSQTNYFQNRINSQITPSHPISLIFILPLLSHSEQTFDSKSDTKCSVLDSGNNSSKCKVLIYSDM